LVIVSRTSAVSIEVITEWRDALARGVRLLVAIIDDIPFLDIPARLRQVQFVNLHDDWDGGLAKIVAAIQAKPADPTISPPPSSAAPAFRSWPVTARPPIDRKLLTIPISGREADIAEIKRLLRGNPTAILGVGGLGKSRLAAEIVMTSDDV